MGTKFTIGIEYLRSARLITAIDHLIEKSTVKNYKEFYTPIGWDANRFQYLKGTATAKLSVVDINKLNSYYPGINWHWVATGDGEMLSPTDTEITKVDGKGLPSELVSDDTTEALKGQVVALRETINAQKELIAAKDRIIELLEKSNPENK